MNWTIFRFSVTAGLVSHRLKYSLLGQWVLRYKWGT